MRVDPTSHPQYSHILAVSAAVLAAERDTDASITTLTRLMGTTIEQFADAKLPAGFAQSALTKLSEAITAQVEGRRMLTEAHKEYGRVAKILGASDDDWGPSWPCPSSGNLAQPAKRTLKVAA
ncbi:MAG: hypothetical protein J0I47_00145 [Sphingomonas sp.]|uniref:hypothetical protein n=1 Tax=Sphingomonas sp. TaxID=28214 RepID=UPI001AC0E5C4|nr:hypothetical protein [Sphingomonas sp.]MBN8806638.1 hypothetical protein [Sphingomonas sp.]